MSDELHLLQLPAEIRNKIFTDVVTVRDRNGKPRIIDCKFLQIGRNIIYRSINVRNRQMRHELLTLFYATNVFHFESFRHTNKDIHTNAYLRALTDGMPGVATYGRKLPGRNLEFGCLAMDLPPMRVRPMLKNVQLTLLVPKTTEPTGGSVWHKSADWFYPILHLLDTGANLKKLEVTIKFHDYDSRTHKWVGEAKDLAAKLKKWLLCGQDNGVATAAEEVKWTFVSGAMHWNDPIIYETVLSWTTGNSKRKIEAVEYGEPSEPCA